MPTLQQLIINNVDDCDHCDPTGLKISMERCPYCHKVIQSPPVILAVPVAGEGDNASCYVNSFCLNLKKHLKQGVIPRLMQEGYIELLTLTESYQLPDHKAEELWPYILKQQPYTASLKVPSRFVGTIVPTSPPQYRDKSSS